ncbi:aspartate aminotransferase [Eubacterium maltosivorans]|uniref:pyridoxal phosphate-dependent aminotransferase n=1 Tax=Eubacterium maltosivorans TaxID=2041044 RepID=UPI00088898AD|nr:pyridoxal phosphate-dependent aminotransferase [Eubacterium maltosivorans]WPK79321.1 Aspartate aminotransferase [Eubacterium maltosivorans]SDP81073.1 aspartate aminotransferase [Eubacterium maltosivorans]
MRTRVSEKVENCIDSLTLSLSEKAKAFREAGEAVVSFGTGEPDFTTPAYICDGAKAAIDAGHTKYDAVTGVAALRSVIARKLKEDNGLSYGMDEIIVNSGAKSSLSVALQTILNPGDEVIIPKPYWVSYTEMVKLAGGVPVVVDTDPENAFKMTAEQMKAAITDKTKAMMLNTPVNPTGVLYSREELQALAAVAVEADILVISDEIYEEFVYDGNKTVSIASLGEAIKNNTILVNGFSKTYAMTGWRLGYAAAPADIIAGMKRIQGHTISHPSTITQYAGITALEEKGEVVDEIIRIFDERRKTMMARLDKIPQLSYIYPQSTFYIFVDISRVIEDNRYGIASGYEFSQRLLNEQKVVTIPGEAFGVTEHIRLSFATSMEEIEEGFNRIEAFLASACTA